MMLTLFIAPRLIRGAILFILVFCIALSSGPIKRRKLDSLFLSNYFLVPKKFTLGKNERLKSRKQIELLFSEGKKFVVSPFRIFYQVNGEWTISKEKNVLHFGIGVSAKNFKRAVDRNIIKRLTREAWRLQKNELKEKLTTNDQQLNVFFIYTSEEMPEYSLVFNKIGTTLKKLIEKIEQQGK